MGRVKLLMIVAAAGLLVTLGGAAYAGTSEPSFTPQSICKKWDAKHASYGKPLETNTVRDGTVVFRVYLLYSKQSGNNCVVTLKDTRYKGYGKPESMMAFLSVAKAGNYAGQPASKQLGERTNADTGSYKYYAVQILPGAGRCVVWAGGLGEFYDWQNTKWAHCK